MKNILLINLLPDNKIERYNHWKYLPIHYINVNKTGYYRVDYIAPIVLSNKLTYNNINPLLSKNSFYNKYSNYYLYPHWKLNRQI